jgi:hypothetical protein
MEIKLKRVIWDNLVKETKNRISRTKNMSNRQYDRAKVISAMIWSQDSTKDIPVCEVLHEEFRKVIQSFIEMEDVSNKRVLDLEKDKKELVEALIKIRKLIQATRVWSEVQSLYITTIANEEIRKHTKPERTVEWIESPTEIFNELRKLRELEGMGPIIGGDVSVDMGRNK